MAKKNVAVAAPAVAVPVEKVAFVEREVATPVRKGQNVYKYGGTEKAAGVPLVATVELGAKAAEYKPRTVEGLAWDWLLASGLIGQPVGAIKEAAKAEGYAHSIAGLLRHAARRGALKVTA